LGRGGVKEVCFEERYSFYFSSCMMGRVERRSRNGGTASSCTSPGRRRRFHDGENMEKKM